MPDSERGGVGRAEAACLLTVLQQDPEAQPHSKLALGVLKKFTEPMPSASQAFGLTALASDPSGLCRRCNGAAE